MYITKEKFGEIRKKYSTLLILDSDAADALNFVRDLLEAEADAIKEKEPQATASIDRLNTAAYEVYEICGDVDNGEFGEGRA